MKKITLALASMLMAGHAAAVDFAISGSAAELASANNAQTVTVTTAANLFIVNPFNFTISAGVGIGGMQNAGNLAVSAGAAKGRTIFTGHSNGGSVSQCGTQTTAGATATPDTLVGDRLSLTKIDGCTAKADLVAAPTPTPTPTP